MNIREFAELPLPDKIEQLAKDALLAGLIEGFVAGFAVATIGIMGYIVLN